MSRVLKLLLSFGIAVLLVGIFMITSSGFMKYRSSVKWTSTNIEINNSDKYEFVSRDYISHIVNSSRHRLNQTPIDSVKVHIIRRAIMKNGYVKSAYVTRGGDGSLNVFVDQFTPVLVMKLSSGLFMFDQNGNLASVNNAISKSLPFFTSDNSSGDMKRFFKNSPKKDISDREIMELFCNFARSVDDDSFLSNMIVQTNINTSGEIELIPRFGAKLIVFCDLNDMDNFSVYSDKLYRFYKKISDENCLERYSVINVKFNNQIVALKK